MPMSPVSARAARRTVIAPRAAPPALAHPMRPVLLDASVRRSPIHPVTSPRVAIPLEREPPVRRRDVEPHGAVAIGARQRDCARLVAGKDRAVRMPEAIAIAYRKYRDARLDRIEERLDRRRAAAVVLSLPISVA
jgi:hypothetical protein